MKHEEVPIEKIQIGDRHRKDMGDLEALASSIREIGLLQPIGVDPYYQLVFGGRRLEACADILGWKRIPCVIVKLESILAGEYSENEFRKQFTKSERAEIGKAIEKELGEKERRGGNRKSNGPIGPLDPKAKGRTTDIAARRAGFTRKTFERTKTVVDRGSPELVAAMDKGEVSTAAAAAIASQPKTEQTRIVAMPKDQQREVVRQIRKTKADQEADERHARDLRLYRGLYDAVRFIGNFHEDPSETWAGIWRVCAWEFAPYLDKALTCLSKLKREHPNEAKSPAIVARRLS